MITRRRFLGGSAAALTGLQLGWLPRGVRAEASPGKRVLVVVMMRGGVDGLSVLVPHGEREYGKVRSTTRVAEPGRTGGAIDLDGRLGLHPKLAPLHGIYAAKKLALVPAAGSPHGTRSHFDAQYYMEIGVPDGSLEGGWLSRVAEGLGGTPGPMRAVAASAGLPRMLYGAVPALALGNLGAMLRGGAGKRKLLGALEALYRGVDGPVGSAGRLGFEALAVLGRAQREPPSGSYPRGVFANQMRQLSRLIRADVGVEVAAVDVGGWDTHVSQGDGSAGILARQLEMFGGTLAAFMDDLGPHTDEVLVVTLSEFGRTVRENGSGGTDHGHGTALLVLGSTVRGGRVAGRFPGLERSALFEGRDVAVTTDFRDLLAEVLAAHLGVRDTARVFPGFEARPARRPGVMG